MPGIYILTNPINPQNPVPETKCFRSLLGNPPPPIDLRERLQPKMGDAFH
eukprot:gene6797-3135_t